MDFTDPEILAARTVRAMLDQSSELDRLSLLRIMQEAYGCTAADDRWSLRDDYDALECGEVLHLAGTALPSDTSAVLSHLTALIKSLPTHSVRNKQQIMVQKFSTPAPIAYLAALVLGLTGTDQVFEPSAGTGLLAVFAARTGACLVLNEIDKAHATLLFAAFPDSLVTHLDAEPIDDLLPPYARPTAVLMNSPFSRSIGRWTDTYAALRLLRAALLCLAPDGRCGVILPDRIDTASPNGRRPPNVARWRSTSSFRAMPMPSTAQTWP